jgi:YD repeat-containing protein
MDNSPDDRRNKLLIVHSISSKLAACLLVFCMAMRSVSADAFNYDATGRLIESVQTNGLVSSFNYDVEGNPLGAQSSSSDTGIAGAPGNGIADWWEAQYFGTFGIDPLGKSGDGMTCLMKFAQGLDPTAITAGQSQTLTSDGSLLSIFFRKGKASTNLYYVVQSSTDLVDWLDLTAATDAALAQPPLTEDETAWGYKVSVPISGTRKFLRLRVSNPE